MLIDKNDLFESGVDIYLYTQPPGKNCRIFFFALDEKSLTALVLLFAFLWSNRLHFSFLDEVDSSLDYVNVGRYNSMI
jgi:chromosome segregation ATPase